MVYITGDKHGDYDYVFDFVIKIIHQKMIL